jgi:hypothetical protein
MDENEIINAVCSHLERTGFSITQRLHTTEQGIDVKARESSTGKLLYIEAKGGTSSRVGSNRFGKDYSPSQVFDRVAKGILTTMETRAAYAGDPKVSVALAVPDSPLFRRHLDAVASQVASLEIRVFMVAANGAVAELV